MGFRAKVREKLSTNNLRRKTTLEPETTSTKSTPLGRSRTNSQASIPEYLRHTRSIPASLKTLFTPRSRPNSETDTPGRKASTRTLGAASTVGGSHHSSLEAVSPYPPATPAEEKAEGAGAAFQGEERGAGKEAQGHGHGEQTETDEEPLTIRTMQAVRKDDQGKVTHPAETTPVETRPISERRQTGEMIGSPVRSQPQEAHSYPPEPTPSECPAVPSRKSSQGGKFKEAPLQPEERSRGLDIEEKDIKPSTGFRMKMKLAWMGLKTKAKL